MKKKRKEKKRNINNNLAIWPYHNNKIDTEKSVLL